MTDPSDRLPLVIAMVGRIGGQNAQCFIRHGLGVAASVSPFFEAFAIRDSRSVKLIGSLGSGTVLPGAVAGRALARIAASRADGVDPRPLLRLRLVYGDLVKRICRLANASRTSSPLRSAVEQQGDNHPGVERRLASQFGIVLDQDRRKFDDRDGTRRR